MQSDKLPPVMSLSDKITLCVLKAPDFQDEDECMSDLRK